MARERRVIRPYPTLAGLAAFSRELVLRVAESEVPEGGRLVLPESTYSSVPITLLVPGADDAARASRISALVGDAGLAPGAVEFVVFAYSQRLRLAEKLFQQRVTDGLPAEIPLAIGVDRADALQASRKGAIIRAFLVLAEEGSRKPLTPWRRWTWLSCAEFRIGVDSGTLGITPIPLTPQMRQEFRLPRGTMRFIRLDGSPLEDAPDADSVQIYVDERLLGSLVANHASRGGRLLQAQLFLDLGWAIASHVSLQSADLPPSYELVENSLLGRFIKAVSSEAGDDGPTVVDLYRELRSDRSRFMALVEAGLKDLPQTILGSMEET